jgi:hypothetical protein
MPGRLGRYPQEALLPLRPVQMRGRSAGAKRAVIALSHTILIIASHILNSGQHYFVKRLQRLGLKVTLEPAAVVA